MPVTIQQLRAWMRQREHEHLEFKEAKQQLHTEKLMKYAAAFANEGGGYLVLGISDSTPRRIVSTQAFRNAQNIKQRIVEKLQLRVEIEELHPPEGRVVVFTFPSRPFGLPIACDGNYLMRSGESLVSMTTDRLRTIFEEIAPDYSATICEQATIDDLDPGAIDIFRNKWHQKQRKDWILHHSDPELLEAAELIFNDEITIAALVLFGTRRALTRHLAQAEVIFEYRSSEASVSVQQRENFRNAFFLIENRLWELVNLRNDVQQFRDGLFRRDIPTFNEDAVREALLNAISHRDYRLGSSIFIRQYPRKLEIISPGGFPAGINETNILNRQYPRNRRIAEAFERCGLVERSGQGVDRMFEAAIKESKPKPDFSQSDAYQVVLVLRGEVKNPGFLRIIEAIGEIQLQQLTTMDLLVLDRIFAAAPLSPEFRESARKLVEIGIAEAVGQGRGQRFLLARKFYKLLDQPAAYTRKKGLDRETNKALLLKHITDNQREGSPLSDLMAVLPGHSKNQVQRLLRDLKKENQIYVIGKTRAALWYPGPEPEIKNADNP